MKEQYMVPEAKIVCFAPVERLAGTPVENYNSLIGAESDDEINTEIKSNPDGNP